MDTTVLLPNLLSFAILAALAVRVLVRPDKAPVHWILLSMLVATLVWNAGSAFEALADRWEETLAAFRVQFLGVAAVPPLWLLLALQTSRWRAGRDAAPAAALLLTPGLVLYVASLTNEIHGAFASASPGRYDYGPLFWALAGWSYACVLAAVAIFLARAWRLARGEEWLRAALLAGAALAPLAVSVTYLFRLMPWTFDPTSASLGISGVLLFPAIFRLSFLDEIPLVRRDVIEHLADGVVIADADGLVVDTNPAARRLLDRARPGRRLADVVRGLGEEADEALLGGLGAASQGERADAEVTAPDGRTLWLRAACVEGRSGEPAGRFVVIHDRTEERRTERALRQAQRLESVGMLAAGVAHEVNNPLAFVRANLVHLGELAEGAKRLADAGPAGEAAELAELPDVVEETREGVERIAGIVASMRSLSRDSEGDRAPVDVNAAVLEAVKLAALSRGPAACSVETRLDADVPWPRASRDGLVQVLLNLVLNARQALRDHAEPCIVVSTRAAEAGVAIEVEDNGPGIRPEHQERVFDPFFTTKGPDEGTGLGLAIAYDLVRDHGGHIALESPPGRGARFTVHLPA